MSLSSAFPIYPAESFADLERVLARTDDMVVRSTALLCRCRDGIRRAHRENARHQEQLDELCHTLSVVRPSPVSIA